MNSSESGWNNKLFKHTLLTSVNLLLTFGIILFFIDGTIINFNSQLIVNVGIVQKQNLAANKIISFNNDNIQHEE